MRFPLAIGAKAIGEVGVEAALESLPEKKFDWSDLGTWGRVAQITVDAAHQIGAVNAGVGRRVSTSAMLFGRFSTSLHDATTGDQRRRFYRSGGVGLRFEEINSHAWGWAAYGCDEAVGPCGVGHLILAGSLPLIGPARMEARAGLGIGKASKAGVESDYLILRLALGL